MLQRTVAISLFMVFFIGSTALLSTRTHADGPCVGGSHIATAADAASATSGGIIVGQTVVCDSDAQAGINATTGAAKQELAGLRCAGSVDVQHLDSKFAVCADKFMKQLRGIDGGACITSAYRSVSDQANACQRICGNPGGCPKLCAPPGSSYHQRGLAIDMRSSVSNQQLWQTAAQSGLYNPSGLHASDPRHLQAGSGTTCAALDVPVGDTGDYYNDTSHYFSSSGLPFDNQVRSALGMQPAPPALPAAPVSSTPVGTSANTTSSSGSTGTTGTGTTATPPTLGTALNTTPYPAGTCAPQTYCYQSDGNIYSRSTTCVDQKYQQCSNGCTGVVCNATSTSSGDSSLSGLLSNTNDNTNANDNSNYTPTSTFDLIDFFTNSQAGGVEIGTATPIDVNENIQNTSDASVLTPGSATTSGIIRTPPQGSIGGIYASAPQAQTFTSADLSQSASSFSQNTFAQQILSQMKASLLAALAYLQPFGGTHLQIISE